MLGNYNMYRVLNFSSLDEDSPLELDIFRGSRGGFW